MSIPAKRLNTILIAVIVFGMIGTGLAVATPDNPSSISDDEVFEVSNDGQIEGWERAAYPLRVNDQDAAVQVPQPAAIDGEEAPDGFTNNDDGQNTKSLIADFNGENNPVGVHDPGSVTIDFDDNRANADLSGESDVQFLTARLTPEDGTGVPASNTGDALDLLSDIDKANANASFSMLASSSSGVSLSDGTYSFNSENAKFNTPGQYIVFAAVKNGAKSGFTVQPDNNVTVDGNVVIIGMDQVTIQEGSSTVTPDSNPQPGDNINFDINAGGLSDSNDVTHAVALYDSEKFETQANFDLVVNSSAFGNDFTFENDSQLEHNIDSVNGIADVEAGTTINGNDLTDGKVQRPVTPSGIIDFLAEEAGTNVPNSDSSKTPSLTMDASTTVVNGEASDTTVTVETFSNFTEGEYRYVIVSALDDAESRTRTKTGTLTIDTPSNNDDDDDDSGSSGGGGSVPTPDEEEEGEETEQEGEGADEDVDGGPSVEDVRQDLDQTEPNTRTQTEVVDRDPNRPGVNVQPEGTESVREITFNDETVSGNVEVTEWQNPPSSVSESVTAALQQQSISIGSGSDNSGSGSGDGSSGDGSSGDGSSGDGSSGETTTQVSANVVSVADINPDSDEARRSPATIQMSVDRDRVDNPQNLVVAHERENSWRTLETSVDETSEEEITVVAETDSFSLFAVAEVTETTQSVSEPETPDEQDDTGIGSTGLIGLLVVLVVIVIAVVAYDQKKN